MKRLILLLWLIPLPLKAQQTDPLVGQVGSTQASVDGVSVPSGTTILDGSRVATGQQPAAIHLRNGRMVRVNPNSTALFSAAPNGDVVVVAERGTVTVRNTDGSSTTLTPYREPQGSGADAPAQAAKPKAPERGVVAVVREVFNVKRAEKGQTVVPVNDTTRVEPTGALLLKTNIGRKSKPDNFCQEVLCSVKSVDCCFINVGEDLVFTFDPEDSVIQRAPVLENKVYTQLRADASSGSTLLSVLDSKAVNPLEPIIVQSADGRYREPACVWTTEEDLPDDLTKIVVNRTLETPNLPDSVVRVRYGLKHDYSRGANIIQGQRFAEEHVVGKLENRLGPGSKVLEVKDASGFDPLQQILLRSPDGMRLEAYCIESIEVNKEDKPDEEQKLDRVFLVEGLDNEFLEGSDLIQGRSSQQMVQAGRSIQRLANCCCCCGDPFAVLAIWWDKPLIWVAGGGAAGAIIGTVITVSEEKPASPSVPAKR